MHLHACFDVGVFLDAALRNFQGAAADLNVGGEWWGCLVVCDPGFDDPLGRLRAVGTSTDRSPWSIQETLEHGSLVVRRQEHGRLVVIPGRQIPTEEALEVLALGTITRFQHRQALSDTLAKVQQAGATPVLPWGFGKWWFARGSSVRTILKNSAAGSVFVGDNGGRPRWSRMPKLITEAGSRGIWNLPGSDPLPFPSQVGRAGSVGFVLVGEVDEGRPAASICDRLAALRAQPRTYGRFESLPRFVRYQVAMQALKRTQAQT